MDHIVARQGLEALKEKTMDFLRTIKAHFLSSNSF